MASARRRPAGEGRGAPFLTRLAQLTTGAKLLLILSLGLLPLALIAIAATLQTTRLADAEMRARLRLTSNESARSIAIEIIGNMTALSAAVRALDRDPLDAPSCARVQGVFAQRASDGADFTVVDRDGRVLCGTRLDGADLRPAPGAQVAAAIAPGRGVLLALRPTAGGVSARAFFPRTMLARLGRPSTPMDGFASSLTLDDEQLSIEETDAPPLPRRVETQRTELGIGGLELRTSAVRPPLSSSLVVAMALPILMWALAAIVAWLVVDRLLIRPLQRLRTSVAAYAPGQVIDIAASGPLPAAEIRELGETFRAISRTVAIHEAGLAEGLVRQTKLTREVHHRVKNNLQVISSLINFHARGAQSPDASAAYASIQRRVDALAVVHRNHFAEMEENRGLNLRTMVGELAANIRATAPEENQGLGITLDVEPLCVNQDVAVAIAFLVTETVELAMNCDPRAQIRIAVRVAEEPDRAVLRVVSRALIESEPLIELARNRYQRVMDGLARQLRSKLHHDPLTGAYEIGFSVLGRA
jgi:two-component system, sensor histidine kinase PdtaS